MSPDGRFEWNGGAWVPRHTKRPVSLRQIARLILGVVTLAVLVGWSGWIDVSSWPLSIPVVLEHCAIRYQGANVSVYYQGPGADRSCDSAASGWRRTSGPPLGSLACYRTPFFGLSWKVYDTGFMLLASQVCNQLIGGATSPGGYQPPGGYPPSHGYLPTVSAAPSPTLTESPEQRAIRLAQEEIDRQGSQISATLSDLSSAMDDYRSMVESMESDIADAQAALSKMQSAYREEFSVEVAVRPMDDSQQYIVWSALDDLNSDFYDVEVATESVDWDDNAEYRQDVVAMVDLLPGQIDEIDRLYAAHPTLRFSITPVAARLSLEALSSQLTDLDARHDAAIITAGDFKAQGNQLWDKSKGEAKKVGVEY